MPPLDRRRRARRQTRNLVLGAVGVAVVLFLIIGGALKVGSASVPYHRSVNRSFAVQASVVVDQSNHSGTQLRQLVDTLDTLGRSELQTMLDSLVTATSAQASSAAALAPPAPDAGAAAGVAGVMATRASATVELRTALYGLLGMVPYPVVGASGAGAGDGTIGGGVPAQLSSAQASADLAAAGASLTAADRRYAEVRRQLRAAPGGGALPASVWVTDPQVWQPGPVASLVDDATTAPSLEPSHQLCLVAVRYTPAVVPTGSAPTPQGTSACGQPVLVQNGQAVLPPTSSLRVTPVLLNDGNVAEPGVTVSVSLQPTTAGTARSVTRTVSVAPGGAQVVDLAPLRVKAGTTYNLTLTVSPPAGQANRNGLTQAVTVLISPATPPTTTPPTTTPPTTTPPKTTPPKTTPTT